VILVNREERAEVEDEAQSPGDGGNDQDGGLEAVGVGDDAGENGSEGRARVLDEIFRGLRRGADLGHGHVIDGGDDVGRGERHEDGRETHENEELVFGFDGSGNGKNEEDRAEQYARARDNDASLFGALEEQVSRRAADEISRGEDEDDGPHREQDGIGIVAAFFFEIGKEEVSDHVPREDACKALQKNEPHGLLLEYLPDLGP